MPFAPNADVEGVKSMADVDVVFCEGWRAMYAVHLLKILQATLYYSVKFITLSLLGFYRRHQ